jgi:ubiquinone/menaquinone biosynthesis C-methylase UbiE
VCALPVVPKKPIAKVCHVRTNDALNAARLWQEDRHTILEKAVLDNHSRYKQRVDFYQSLGYDLEKERGFILDRSLPVSGDILEIGTGKGHFALALAKRGYSFISIDISKTEQQIAELNLKYFGLLNKADFRIRDAKQTGFPDKSFDVIFSINVFHHIDDPAMVLKEIRRLIRPCGRVILSDFTDKGLSIINKAHTLEGKTHDYFKNSFKKAEDYFNDLNFKTEKFQSNAQEVLIARNSQG